MKLSTKICLLILLGFALSGAIHWYALKSVEFKFVQVSLENSHSVQEMFGRPVKVTLPAFGSFKEKSIFSDEGKSSEVSMVVNVVGNVKSADISVILLFKNGTWQIKNSTLEGQLFIID